jgi:hypothetical protein
MSDRRPDRVYGILVADGRVFLRETPNGLGLPGGRFAPLADDRKGELRAYLLDQLGIAGRAIWAQGAFDYWDPAEELPAFSGFYTVWEWDGDVPPEDGQWLDAEGVARAGLHPSVQILLTSVLATKALKTT